MSDPLDFIRLNRRVRRLAFDYALATAIVALLPLPQFWRWQWLAILALQFKLMRDIGRCWHFPRGQGLLALLGNLVGLLGALALAAIAWTLVVVASTLLPALLALAPGAAALFLTWTIGQMTHQFYLSSSRLPVAELAAPEPSETRHEAN